MTAKQIFTKTMPFVWAKLFLGLITVLISGVLFAILMGIGWLFGDSGMLITFLLWISATGVVRFIIMHYFGYLVKAGHIAVISEAVITGQIPASQVAYGKQKVTERFVTSNVYFAVDKLVAGAVKQLQNVIQKTGNALDFIPGMNALVGVGKFFIEISLGYIDECCLGYTFYKKEQGAFQSAADGVVIYAQNWKVLLKNAAKTMVGVLLGMLMIVLILFIAIGGLFKILGFSPLVAFLLACFAAWAVKFAVLDSWIMIKMMVAYMQVAPQTQITFDLYQKLCGLSGKFKELFGKASQEATQQTNSPQPAGYSQQMNNTQSQQHMNNTQSAPYQQVTNNLQTLHNLQPGSASQMQHESKEQTAAATENPVFCGQCGAKNSVGVSFCGSCGTKMS